VAVSAISSSAVLVRWADAGAVSLAFWRTAGGAAVLGIGLGLRRRPAEASSTSEAPQPSARQPWPVLGAGLALALHFAAWLASLELTSVAASVTLVSTTPLLVAMATAAMGTRLPGATWWGTGLAVLGGVAIAGGDLGRGRDALLGDALALLGAAAMTTYLLLGQSVRATMSTARYGALVYATAALVLAPIAFVVGGDRGRYDAVTWLVIGAMILGPQLLGHTVLNWLLRPLGSVTVSLALLGETTVATLAAWALLGEAPPLGAVVGMPLVVAGIALHLRGTDPDRQPVQSTSRWSASSR
jgi:drug/metabolite transporter (DMT)-like permease